MDESHRSHLIEFLELLNVATSPVQFLAPNVYHWPSIAVIAELQRPAIKSSGPPIGHRTSRASLHYYAF